MSDFSLQIPRLDTSRLILRGARAEDWEAYRAYSFSRRNAGGSASELDRWLRFTSFVGHWAVRGFGRFIIEEKTSGAAVGHVGPFRPEGWPENELTWTLWTEEAEGKGLAFEAASAARAFAYETLGWSTAVSYIVPWNGRSIALAERLGATLDREAERRDPKLLVYRHPAPGVLR